MVLYNLTHLCTLCLLVSNHQLYSYNLWECYIISFMYDVYQLPSTISVTPTPCGDIIRQRRAGQRTGPPSTSAWTVLWSGLVGKYSITVASLLDMNMSLFPQGVREALIVGICHFFSCHYWTRREEVNWNMHDVILFTVFSYGGRP